MSAPVYSPLFRNPDEAFNNAVESGKLSKDARRSNFAGNYMYMHTDINGYDHFKHVMTRRYLDVKNEPLK